MERRPDGMSLRSKTLTLWAPVEFAPSRWCAGRGLTPSCLKRKKSKKPGSVASAGCSAVNPPGAASVSSYSKQSWGDARSGLGSPGLWGDAGRASDGQGCGPGRGAHGHVLPCGGLFVGSGVLPATSFSGCGCDHSTLVPRSLEASCLVSGPKQDCLL